MLKVALYRESLQSTATGDAGDSICSHVDDLEAIFIQGMRLRNAAQLGIGTCRSQAAGQLRAAGPCRYTQCSSLESPLQGEQQC